MSHNTPTIKRTLTYEEIWECKNCDSEANPQAFYDAYQQTDHIYCCPNPDCRVYMPSKWESIRLRVKLTMSWPTYHPKQ